MERKQLLLGYLVRAILIVSSSYAEGQSVSPNAQPSRPSNPLPSQAQAGPLEIANGEYAIFREYGGIGPDDAEIYDFHEDWSILMSGRSTCVRAR